MTMFAHPSSRRQCSRQLPLRRTLFFILACTICILHCGLIITSVNAQQEEQALFQQADADNDNVTEQLQPQVKQEKEVDDDPPHLEEDTQDPSSSSSLIVEKDYLDHLSTAALRKICLDRGFDVAPPQQDDINGTTVPLTREDYLEAARRCLTLEDEINLILVQHPELAAELESEVERMRQQKERLEEERNELLAELRLLQSQLENAGVDISNIASLATTKDKTTTTNLKDIDPNNMTFEQVMRYTLTELVERVKGDVKFVWSLVRPVVAPVIPTVQKLWKSFGQPLAKQAWKVIQKIVGMGVEEYKKRTNEDYDDTTTAGPLSAAASPAR